jgi:hypothetical protein
MFQHPATLEGARRFARASHLLRLVNLLPEAKNAPGLALPQGGLEDCDPMAQLAYVAQMAQADAADASLLRLVLCAAGATLALAVASSLM